MKQIEKETKRAEKANQMKPDEVKSVVKSMKAKGHLVRKGKYYKCLLVPNKKSGYAQVDVTKYCKDGSKVSKKVLVHHIWWRYKNGYNKISKKHEISHLHVDNTILDLVEESWEMNQSRKWCHHFGWYAVLEGEDAPRCPHKECPCKG